MVRKSDKTTRVFNFLADKKLVHQTVDRHILYEMDETELKGALERAVNMRKQVAMQIKQLKAEDKETTEIIRDYKRMVAKFNALGDKSEK